MHTRVTVPVIVIAVLCSSCGWLARVNVSTTGTQANHGSNAAADMSGDGRYVVFATYADNLVVDDTNGAQDVFRRDTRDGTTVRVSVSTNGDEANDYSRGATISADGRYVAYLSRATNLVDNPGPGGQVYVWDAATGETTLVSVSSGGTPANNSTIMASISATGRYVTFNSLATNLVAGDINGQRDEFVHDRHTGTTTRVSIADDGSEGNESSYGSTISADGRLVAFASTASNLVEGDTNGVRDVFVRDRLAETTIRVNVATNGQQADDGTEGWGEISADGSAVVFTSWADNLTAGDTNGTADVFVHDLGTGVTERVSVATDGTEGNGRSRAATISGDGRLVAFRSNASNLVDDDPNGDGADIFLRDRVLDSTREVAFVEPPTDWGADAPALSADGRYVTFLSSSRLFFPPDNFAGADIYIRALPGAEAVAVTPSSLAIGEIASVTITGTDLDQELSAYFGSGVDVLSITPIDSTRVQLELAVHESAEPGSRSVMITTPGTGPGSAAVAISTCQDCIDLTAD